MIRTLALVVAIATAGLPRPGAAQETVAQFYKGKQIDLMVGAAAGGAYDLTARLVARYLSKYIPGNPTIVVENAEGAGGLSLANQIYNSSPKDGTTIAVVQNGVPTLPYFRPENVRFDPNKLSWIGSPSRELEVVAIWSTSPIKSFDDLTRQQAVMGAMTAGLAPYDYAVVANALLGTRFKIVLGYPSVPAIDKAMESGEVLGNAALGWVYLKSAHRAWLTDDKVKVLGQWSFDRATDLPDTPAIGAISKTETDRQAFRLLFGRDQYGRPFFGPPGIPADRLSALRAAFTATLTDEGFLKDAEKAGMPVVPVSGEQLAAMAKTLAETPEDVVDRLRTILQSRAD